MEPTPTAPHPSPAEAPLFTRLRVAFQSFRMLVKDATDPVHGPLFQESIDGGRYIQWVRQLAQEAEGSRLLSERPSLSVDRVDFEALSRLPPGTLGHAFARFYLDKGLNPLASHDRQLSDVQYLAQRMRETHDLHHLLTGYGTDMLGEQELQAFQYGNLRTPTSLIALGHGVAVELPRHPAEYLRRVRAAFQRGRVSRPIASIPWEEHWETPLKHFQEQFCSPRENTPPVTASA
ncbi:Coq4 family protein [Archangium sp.]|uniref:Coq4 family protein n=1 Tax=Archangium sp. TaxID=1872627 RepID=UPI00389AA26F